MKFKQYRSLLNAMVCLLTLILASLAHGQLQQPAPASIPPAAIGATYYFIAETDQDLAQGVQIIISRDQKQMILQYLLGHPQDSSRGFSPSGGSARVPRTGPSSRLRFTTQFIEQQLRRETTAYSISTFNDDREAVQHSYEYRASGNLQQITIRIVRTDINTETPIVVRLRRVQEAVFHQRMQSLIPRVSAYATSLEDFNCQYFFRMECSALVAHSETSREEARLDALGRQRWSLPVFGTPRTIVSDNQSMKFEPPPSVTVRSPMDFARLIKEAEITCLRTEDCPQHVGLMMILENNEASQCTANYWREGGWFSSAAHCIPRDLRSPENRKRCSGRIFVKMPAARDQAETTVECEEIEYVSNYDESSEDHLQDLVYFRVKNTPALRSRTPAPIEWQSTLNTANQTVTMYVVNPVDDAHGLNGIVQKKVCRTTDPYQLNLLFPETRSGYPVVFYDSCDFPTRGGNSGAMGFNSDGKGVTIHSSVISSYRTSREFRSSTALNCLAPTDHDAPRINISSATQPAWCAIIPSLRIEVRRTLAELVASKEQVRSTQNQLRTVEAERDRLLQLAQTLQSVSRTYLQEVNTFRSYSQQLLNVQKLIAQSLESRLSNATYRVQIETYLKQILPELIVNSRGALTLELNTPQELRADHDVRFYDFRICQTNVQSWAHRFAVEPRILYTIIDSRKYFPSEPVFFQVNEPNLLDLYEQRQPRTSVVNYGAYNLRSEQSSYVVGPNARIARQNSNGRFIYVPLCNSN